MSSTLGPSQIGQKRKLQLPDWIETQKWLGGAPANQLPGVNWQLLQNEQREVFLQVVTDKLGRLDRTCLSARSKSTLVDII